MNAHPRDFKQPLPDAIEAALLGAILNSNECYWRVAGFLKPNISAKSSTATSTRSWER